jgi:membrane-bound lytic murein transglycosylase D
VQQFKDGRQQAADQPTSMLLAAPESAGDSAGDTTSAPSKPVAQSKTHTVQSGESLWLIAHHYSVKAAELQRWNHLHGQSIKPGQVLKVSGAE